MVSSVTMKGICHDEICVIKSAYSPQPTLGERGGLYETSLEETHKQQWSVYDMLVCSCQ